MSYWWHVKRYGETPLRVSEKAAAAAWDAKVRGEESITIRVDGNDIGVSTKSISSVEPTLERRETGNPYLLTEVAGAALLPYGKGRPVFAPDFKANGIDYHGGVICNWYKKNIDRKEWDTYYSKFEKYYRIDDPDSSVWVAMYLPEEAGSAKPNYLIQCTGTEINHLEQRRNRA